MSAEVLRGAAAEMRFDAPALSNDPFLLAVADWLDLTASRWLPDDIPWPHEVAALAVATTYLNESS